MTLGLNTGSNGADFLPIVVYDARAGRLFKVERTQTASGWESNRVDITNPPPAFAIDFGTIEVGWITFSATGPDFKMVPLGKPLPPQPTKDYKQGFRVKISGRVVDGIREFSHTAKCVLTAIDSLHIRYEAAPEAAAGKIPVVKLTGTAQIVTTGPQGKTTNYAPVFDIIAWTDRAPEMGERTTAIPSGASASPQPPAGHVPPPAAKEPAKEQEPPAYVTERVPETASAAGMPAEW